MANLIARKTGSSSICCAVRKFSKAPSLVTLSTSASNLSTILNINIYGIHWCSNRPSVLFMAHVLNLSNTVTFKWLKVQKINFLLDILWSKTKATLDIKRKQVEAGVLEWARLDLHANPALTSRWLFVHFDQAQKHKTELLHHNQSTRRT